jgi:hypothetical protein
MLKMFVDEYAVTLFLEGYFCPRKIGGLKAISVVNYVKYSSTRCD